MWSCVSMGLTSKRFSMEGLYRDEVEVKDLRNGLTAAVLRVGPSTTVLQRPAKFLANSFTLACGRSSAEDEGDDE